MALSISHRPPPPAKPLDASLRGLSRHQRRHRHPHHQAGPHGRHRRAVGAERPADPVREHRREARLSAVRHPGEDPPLAGARARDVARRIICARLPTGCASRRADSSIGQDRPGERGGEAAQRGGLDRAADPVPQGQGRGALCHGDEHHPRSRDRLLQFLSRRHPRGRTAPRPDQLRHAALARHHAQIPRAWAWTRCPSRSCSACRRPTRSWPTSPACTWMPGARWRWSAPSWTATSRWCRARRWN